MSMRIAYVAPYVDQKTLLGGVGSKIRSQIQIWQEQGHEVRLFALSPDDIQAEGVKVFPYKPAADVRVVKSISRQVSRSRAISKLASELQLYQPHLIYKRFARFVYPVQRVLQAAPTVLELNSDDVNENLHLGRSLYWFNRLTRGLLIKNSAGLIPVSHEIAQLKENTKYGKPVKVIANGINLDLYEQLPPPSNPKPVITFVGSPGMTWHGVDKLVHVARKCPDLTINVVGYRSSDIGSDLPPNLNPHGFLNRENVKSILMKSDVAVGSLALHRNRMNEGSPLKVREAAAFGLPLILGYQDTDLFDLETDCILRLPSTEDNVAQNTERIRSFAYAMIGRRLDRKLVSSRISYQFKEETRLQFFHEIAGK